tara:strand:- start:1063 stop:2301 length:1239 start_codon:yes stop_codon:yes gene_type:complete
MKTVFYSWQADQANNLCRNFIEAALKKAIKELSTELAIVTPDRKSLVLDKDTKGVPGSPPIADTILKKIQTATIFVPDLTFVSTRVDGRKAPNPNVLIEYGFALNQHGHAQIVPVMNTAFGSPSNDEMPFNLRHLKNPIQYHLADSSTSEERASQKTELVRVLKQAIRDVVNYDAENATPAEEKFPFDAVAFVSPDRLRPAAAAIGICESPRLGDGKVYLKGGPTMWLRIAPETPPPSPVKRAVLKANGIGSNGGFLRPLNNNFSGYDYFRAPEGWGTFALMLDDPSITPTLAMAFPNGQIWAADTYQLATAAAEKHLFLNKKMFADSLDNYSRFLGRLGMTGPMCWEAGISGIEGWQLFVSESAGSLLSGTGGGRCVQERVSARGMFVPGTPPLEVLTPFFEEVYDACGMP